MFDLHNLQISTPIVPFRESLGVENCIGKDKATQLLADIYYENLPLFLKDEFENCKFDSETSCPSNFIILLFFFMIY